MHNLVELLCQLRWNAAAPAEADTPELERLPQLVFADQTLTIVVIWQAFLHFRHLQDKLFNQRLHNCLLEERERL